jgi:DNA-binding transcriptional regulator YiaG
MIDEYCYDCKFYTPYDRLCNYDLVTGYSRRCPLGTGCDKKAPLRKRIHKNAEYHKNLGEYHARELFAEQNIIKDYRKRHGLSMEDFAKLVGRSKQAVCDWERGWYRCPHDILEKVRNDEQF